MELRSIADNRKVVNMDVQDRSLEEQDRSLEKQDGEVLGVGVVDCFKEGDEKSSATNSVLRSSHQKRARDERYAVPTMEEGRLLRESESKPFKGNLLRLEVEELLQEVRVDYNSKIVRATEEWLHELKGALEALPPAVVTEKSLGLRGIKLANHVPGKPVTLHFRPPEAQGFELAGSYMLRCLVQPSLHIDLAVHIPAECLVPRDSLNHRYLDKRALYAGQIAKEALDKAGGVGRLVERVEISHFRGDPRKPVVLLHPDMSSLKGMHTKRGRFKDGSHKTNKSRLKATFVIRILPCCNGEVMIPARLAPGRNNVRSRDMLRKTAEFEGTDKEKGEAEEALLSLLPPTPHYNSAILEDMCMRKHVTALHGICGASEAFRDAIILGKVWLAQHGMRASHDSLGGYGWSMIVLYLARSRRINGRMAALNIFQVVLKFIVDKELSSTCLTLTSSSENAEGVSSALTEADERAFKEAFPVVLVDTALGLNVMARLSPSAVMELEMVAGRALRLLQERPEIAFRLVFMTRSTLWRKCDAFVQIPLYGASSKMGQLDLGDPPNAEKSKKDEELGLLDKSLWNYVSTHVTRILTEGLGDRCVLARPLCGVAGEARTDFQGVPGPPGWNPRSCSPPAGDFASYPVENGPENEESGLAPPYLTLGLIFNSTFAGRLVDRGPPAEDGPAARRFREFWGEKSELRRFKDGSIVEAVIWKGKGAQRHRIVEQVTRHILARHDPWRCYERKEPQKKGRGGVRFLGNELLGLVSAPLSMEGEKYLMEDEEMTRLALKAFEKLQERVKMVDGMPLRVQVLQAVSPLLRYTSSLPPLPHPLATSPRCTEDAEVSLPPTHSKMSCQVEPIEVLLRLESSSKWPDELDAIRSTGTAFLLRLAQCLEKQFNLRCRVSRTFVDVLSAGFCFRLRLGNEKELACSQRQKGNSTDVLCLRQFVMLAAPHHSSMHGLHLQQPAFGLIVRAVMRWLEEHMMSEHLRIEAVELLTASLFTEEAPLQPPATVLAGFLRVLLLLAGHDWATAPLVVDPQKDLTSADREAAADAFARSRDRDPEGGDAMYLIAPYARDGGWSSSWTWPNPERPVLGRLVALAKVSADSIIQWLSGRRNLGSAQDGWKTVFRISAAERETFDARLILGEGVCYHSGKAPLSRRDTFERRSLKGFPALRIKAYKNLSRGDEHNSGLRKTLDALIIGFDPITDLVLELRRRFGHMAVFFSPGHLGSTGQIGIVWRPSALIPRIFNMNYSRHELIAGRYAENGEVLTVTSLVEVLGEMKAVGGDMIKEIRMS